MLAPICHGLEGSLSRLVTLIASIHAFSVVKLLFAEPLLEPDVCSLCQMNFTELLWRSSPRLTKLDGDDGSDDGSGDGGDGCADDGSC